jgi:hypothetical protein
MVEDAAKASSEARLIQRRTVEHFDGVSMRWLFVHAAKGFLLLLFLQVNSSLIYVVVCILIVLFVC